MHRPCDYKQCCAASAHIKDSKIVEDLRTKRIFANFNCVWNNCQNKPRFKHRLQVVPYDCVAPDGRLYAQTVRARILAKAKHACRRTALKHNMPKLTGAGISRTNISSTTPRQETTKITDTGRTHHQPFTGTQMVLAMNLET